MTGPLLRQAGVAVWQQIVAALGRGITAGTPPPGGRLPSEAQLAAGFGVNRHTVRRAIEALSRQGLVRVEHGRGVFVPDDVLDYTVAARTRFSEWIRRHNKEPSGRTLRLERVAAAGEVAAGLALRRGTQVVLFERLGFADGVPVSIGTHHFPARRLPGLFAALRRGAGISEALAAGGIADYRRQITRVGARLPEPREAELLHMPAGRPLLLTENVNVDGEGRVVEYSVARYPTPRVQIVFEP